jgi:hypothetical protein
MKYLFALCLVLLLVAAPAHAQILKSSGGQLLKTSSGAILNANVSQLYMAFNTRQRLAGSPPSMLANVSEVSRIAFNTPSWNPINPRFYFACWIGDNTGSYPIEKAPSGNCTIDGAKLETVANTTFTNITFSGSTSVTIAAGSGIWSDAVNVTLLANSVYWTRQSVTVGSGQTFFGNYNAQTFLGEGAYFNGSPTLSLLTSTWTPIFISLIYGPSFYAAQGWDGTTPVVLATGDSIGYGLNENEHTTGNTRGDFGYIMRGLDDNASSSRYAAETFCIPGANALSDSSATAGYYGRRLAILNGLPNVPFTTLLDEHGTNDNTLADLQGWWNFLKNNLNASYIVKTTIPPHTTTAANTAFDSYTNQTPINSAYTYPSGNVWTVNAGITSGSYSSYLNTFIDLNPYASGVGTSYPDRWFVPSFTTTLAANASSGASSVSTNAAPNVGDCMAIDSGNASVDSDGSQYGLVVSAVTGSGPYTVALGNGGTLSANHSSGASVTEQFSKDGLHPGQCGHIAMAAAIISAKNAGKFH